MLYMRENDKETCYSQHFLKMITKNRKKMNVENSNVSRKTEEMDLKVMQESAENDCVAGECRDSRQRLSCWA